MVRGILSAVGREIKGMHEAAYLLAAFALLSQLLALVRDRLLAASFGASHTLDVYYAAFRIPDFLFATVASLLSLYALLPVLSRLEREHPGLVISFMRQALLWFFVAMAAVCALAAIFAPQILSLAAPGLYRGDPSLLMLTRILLLQPVLLGASNILANLTQLRHRFVLYSVSPLLYNLGIIFGIVALYPRMGLAGLGWGVVIGALLHMLVQVPYFVVEPGAEPLPWRRGLRYLGEVLKLSVPRTLALSANQISLLCLTALASFLSAGSISVFSFAWNLQAVPLTIIGVSYSVAAFPTLSRLFAGGHSSEFASHVSVALRHIIFWAVPATVLAIVLRAQLVRVILGAGAFDWPATRLVAAALALLVVSLLAQSASLLIARAYYAAGNTRKPFYFALVDVVVSVGLALILSSAFHESLFVRYFVEALLRVSDLSGTTVLMLALALSAGSIAEFAVGMRSISRDFALGYEGLRRLFFQSFAAAVIGGACAYAALSFSGHYLDLNTLWGIFAQGALGGMVGLLATAAVLVLLRNPEIAEVWAAFARKFRDTPPVVLEPSDISS
jgi:putative peptidoglycan lipid II flippase